MEYRVCIYCGLPSVIFSYCKHLCPMHFRIRQMRLYARRDRKAVPTTEQLIGLVQSSGGLKCTDCHRQMNWFKRDGSDTVVSLQHYRDGSFGLVCLSCNARHRAYDGDSYRLLPKDHKKCCACKRIMPLSAFCNNRSNFMGKAASCRSCEILSGRKRFEARCVANGRPYIPRPYRRVQL